MCAGRSAASIPTSARRGTARRTTRKPAPSTLESAAPKAFLDGMVDGASGGSRLVDGHELSYGFRDPARFPAAYRGMKEDLLPLVASPMEYARVFSFGFGTWMDHDWRKCGWDAGDPAKNHFAPEPFEAAVRKSLETADELVWIYSETPRWWSAEGKAVKLLGAYPDALRRARKGLAAE